LYIVKLLLELIVEDLELVKAGELVLQIAPHTKEFFGARSACRCRRRMSANVQHSASVRDREVLVEDGLPNVNEDVVHVIGRRRRESRCINLVLLEKELLFDVIQ